MPKPGRRIIWFSRQLLEESIAAPPRRHHLFRGITSDAPNDLRIISIRGIHDNEETVEIVAESREWSEVPEGAALPQIEIEHTAHYEAEQEDPDAQAV